MYFLFDVLFLLQFIDGKNPCCTGSLIDYVTYGLLMRVLQVVQMGAAAHCLNLHC